MPPLADASSSPPTQREAAFKQKNVENIISQNEEESLQRKRKPAKKK